MALVNSDLFLVQDAETKTNYKVSFESIASQIDPPVDLESRVAVIGDNMTGNLTLGNTKIVLDAATGKGTFAGDKIRLHQTGYIEAWRATENAGDKLLCCESNIGTVKKPQVTLYADGSGIFTGKITAKSFKGDGSELTNLPIQPELWVENDDNLSPITADRNITSIKNILSIGQFITKRIPYSSNQDAPYVIASTPAYDGTTANWGTFGFQHRLKSNSSGAGRVTIDTNKGEAFCVLVNKNVGIGTNEPKVALEVNGTIEATNIDGGTYA